MGTSASYDTPPAWGNLKRQAGIAASAVGPERCRNLVNGFVGGNGGASSFARGGGLTGGGGAARRVAGGLAGFVSEVGRSSLDAALRGWGLAELIGRPAGEILEAIIDRCGTDGATLEEVDARNALSDVMHERLDAATTAADVEAILAATADQEGLIDLLADFFGLYVFHAFCRSFWGHVAEKEGADRADGLMGEVRDYIVSAVENATVDVDVTRIDWLGAEGQRLAADIFERTLRVFGWDGEGKV